MGSNDDLLYIYNIYIYIYIVFCRHKTGEYMYCHLPLNVFVSAGETVAIFSNYSKVFFAYASKVYALLLYK